MSREEQKLSVSGVFIFACWMEGATWSGLLVGMFLKYVTETTQSVVWLFGRLHGAAFLFYVVVTIVAAWRLRWPWWVAGVALLASLPPLITIPMEIWFKKRGFIKEIKTT